MARSGTYFADPKSAAGRAPKARLIYVEGADDANFLDGVLAEEGANPAEVGIVFTEGQNQILPNLTELLKTSPYVTRIIKHIAIVKDANGNPAQSLANLHGGLPGLGLPQPAHGTFAVYDGDRNLGLFLIPSDTESGALEDLLLQTVATDARLTRADQLIADAEAETAALDHRIKRVMRAYLASCPVDSSGCGRAFKNGWFNHANPALNPLRQFINQLLAL